MSSSVLPSPPSLQLDVSHYRLNCGAQLYFKAMPGAPRLAINLYLRGGNQLDEVPGQVDLIDRLLTKGTPKRDAEAIAIALDSLSLEMDIETRRDYSILGGTLLVEDLDASLALIAELLFDSTLAELPREVDKLEGELAMALDSPKARASDQLVRALYGPTPYATVSTVLQENLKAASQATALRDLYERAYRPDRFILTVAGDIAPERLIEALETALDVLAPSTAAVGSSALPNILGSRVIEQPTLVTHAWPDAKQAHLYKAWLAPKATHPDVQTLQVLNTILGGAGLSSRLFTELRDKQGLAYNVRSSLETYQYSGAFTLYIGTEPSNVTKCLQGFEEECRKLIEIPVSATELEDAKRNVLGRRTVFLETASQWASWIGGNILSGRSLADIESTSERIWAVTPEDISRLAHQIFTSAPVVSIAGPASCLPTSL